MNIKNLIILDQILAVASLAALIVSHLALTDIAHGEPDARAEWLILQLTAALLIVFIVFSHLALRRSSQER